MLKNKTVQLQHGNLMHSIGGNLQTLEVSKDLHTKINRAIRNNKGIRLTDKHYIGGKLSLTDKILKPLTKGVSKVFTNKKVSNTGISLGETTNNKILPFVAVAGKPVFMGVAGMAGSTLGGPVGGVASTTAANVAYDKFAQPVANRQKDKNLKKLSDLSGKFAVNKLSSSFKFNQIFMKDFAADSSSLDNKFYLRRSNYNEFEVLISDFKLRNLKHYKWLGDSPERIELIAKLSKNCDHITEFGVYSGCSTLAFLLSKPNKLISYDITDKYFSFKKLEVRLEFLNLEIAMLVIPPY
jgi:hypothetical protein